MRGMQLLTILVGIIIGYAIRGLMIKHTKNVEEIEEDEKELSIIN